MRLHAILVVLLAMTLTGCATLAAMVQGVAECGAPLLGLDRGLTDQDWGRAGACLAVHSAGGVVRDLESASPMTEYTPEQIEAGRAAEEAAHLQAVADADPTDDGAQRDANAAARACHSLAQK